MLDERVHPGNTLGIGSGFVGIAGAEDCMGLITGGEAGRGLEIGFTV